MSPRATDAHRLEKRLVRKQRRQAVRNLAVEELAEHCERNQWHTLVRKRCRSGAPTALTWNGAASHASTSDARVDFFFGAQRHSSPASVAALVQASFAADPLDTLKIAAYVRDIRGGKGERDAFRHALVELARLSPDDVAANLPLFAGRYGRFDDLLVLLGTPVEDRVVALLAAQLQADVAALATDAPVSLCAKWMPSEGRGPAHKLLCRHLRVTFAAFRKQYLAPLRQRLFLVERFMCAREWTGINYKTIPSLALHRYNRAFDRHDHDRFTAWLHDLFTSQSTVNGKDIFPHQLVQRYIRSPHAPVDMLAEAQWAVLRSQAAAIGNLGKTLVMSDVSGSMLHPNGLPMCVSIALGILISEVVPEPFRNLVLTFESNPCFHNVVGDNLQEKVHCLAKAPWGGSTNLARAMELILSTAKAAHVAPADMPERLVVISDMQFNGFNCGKITNLEHAAKLYRLAGYNLPHVVFWNVNGAIKDVHATANDAGVSLISGFTPNVLKAAVAAQIPQPAAKVSAITPFETMRNAIDDARYSDVRRA
ncbi:hypothetical protein ACHHYP_13929 [Achlya hypogyna]|uniref:TROVE domain-containing protein n=1 Tax=Achlya hypogyna TaxID=1202772 RepID=A0A1V9YEH1_ACHHY|nr:hypothetical protein ACHHYP_13929 [Achlya hypogyna]